MIRRLAVMAVAGVGLGVLLFYLARPPAVPAVRGEPAPAAGDQEPAPNTPARSGTREAPPAARKVAQPQAPPVGELVLPDGKRVPALNGVQESVDLLWPVGVPFSPITGTRTEPGGVQWYVHADGSRSTTQMVWRSDRGRAVAMSIVANPNTPAPTKTAEDEHDQATRGKAPASPPRAPATGHQ